MANKRIRTTIIATALVACLAIGGISAYFTDGDTKTNTFTVGSVEIDLVEENWNPDNVTKITPQEDLAKDPKVKNTGDNSAYVFVEVKVPYAEVKTAGEDGTVAAAADTQLFTWDLNDGWVLVESDLQDTDSEGVYTYVYAYGTTTAMTEVAADAETVTVFDHVRFANVIEDEGLEGEDLDIVVNAYAIQTTNINDAAADIDGTNNDGKVAPADVWSVVKNQSAEMLFDDKTGEDPNTDEM